MAACKKFPASLAEPDLIEQALREAVAFPTLFLEAGGVEKSCSDGDAYLMVIMTMLELAQRPSEFAMAAFFIRRLRWNADVIDLWCRRLAQVFETDTALVGHDLDGIYDRMGRQTETKSTITDKERSMLKAIQKILSQRNKKEPPRRFTAKQSMAHLYRSMAAGK